MKYSLFIYLLYVSASKNILNSFYIFSQCDLKSGDLAVFIYQEFPWTSTGSQPSYSRVQAALLLFIAGRSFEHHSRRKVVALFLQQSVQISLSVFYHQSVRNKGVTDITRWANLSQHYKCYSVQVRTMTYCGQILETKTYKHFLPNFDQVLFNSSYVLGSEGRDMARFQRVY